MNDEVWVKLAVEVNRLLAESSTASPSRMARTRWSPGPTLGYGVSYAVGNVLLALWGHDDRRAALI
jgi:hypothetical protein